MSRHLTREILADHGALVMAPIVRDASQPVHMVVLPALIVFWGLAMVTVAALI